MGWCQDAREKREALLEHDFEWDGRSGERNHAGDALYTTDKFRCTDQFWPLSAECDTKYLMIWLCKSIVYMWERGKMPLSCLKSIGGQLLLTAIQRPLAMKKGDVVVGERCDNIYRLVELVLSECTNQFFRWRRMIKCIRVALTVLNGSRYSTAIQRLLTPWCLSRRFHRFAAKFL